MDKVFSVGEIFLELFCVSIMLLVFVYVYRHHLSVSQITRDNMQASDYQAEYASQAVYEGSDIAYTEVLNCVYVYSSGELPVIVHTIAGLLPVPVNPTPNDITNFINNHSLVYRGTGAKTYAEISEELRTRAKVFRGEVLRRDNGVAYAIRFTY